MPESPQIKALCSLLMVHYINAGYSTCKSNFIMSNIVDVVAADNTLLHLARA
jgi:hypothetical protein